MTKNDRRSPPQPFDIFKKAHKLDSEDKVEALLDEIGTEYSIEEWVNMYLLSKRSKNSDFITGPVKNAVFNRAESIDDWINVHTNFVGDDRKFALRKIASGFSMTPDAILKLLNSKNRDLMMLGSFLELNAEFEKCKNK